MDPAIYIKITRQWQYIRAQGIAYLYCYCVYSPGFNEVSDLDTKGCITTFMLGYKVLVHKYRCYGVCPFKIEEQTFIFPFGLRFKAFFIDTRLAFIIDVSKQYIFSVPGMR